MKNILQTKLKREVSFRRSLLIIVFVMVYVYIFLCTFSPFYLKNYPGIGLFKIAGLYTLACFISPFLFICSERFLVLPFFDKDNWTIGKEILTADIIILPTAFLFLLIDVNYHDAPFSFWGYLIALKHVVLISIIPVLLVIALKFNLALFEKIERQKKHKSFIQKEVHKIGPVDKDAIEEPTVVFINSENKSDSFKLLVDQFYFAVSDGNYIDIHFKLDNKNRKKTIRGSMTRLLQDFEEYPAVVKSHRSYLVNTKKIISCEGNSRGQKIKFSDDLQEVPVSRNFISKIKSMTDEN